MIIAIDIGGTKTLVAAVDEEGQIANQIKFPTPQNYKEFINMLANNISVVTVEKPTILSIAIPGKIDRERGVVTQLGNLPWVNKSVVKDIAGATGVSNILIENDANLAALSEANSLENTNQRVMYVTFSTGVGTGFVINGRLAQDLLDSEGGHMVFMHDGKYIDWEEFAAGKAIVEKYGKRASDLDDPVAWREISKDMAIGIVDNCAVFMPDTVIIGGGVGTYFSKYGDTLREEIDKLIPVAQMVPRPMIVGAKNAEEAVVLGCIINAQQNEQHK
jgi:predicted NBD/HSP70 family sugar kinase